jgi:lysophospholipase L1-like esterase
VITNYEGFEGMKLTDIELKALRKMIENTSSKVLDKYKNDNLNSHQGIDYLFLGDSMIEFFKLEKYLPNINAINRGIAGATTKLILDNIDTIFGSIIPKSIYVSIGSNDLVLLEADVDTAFLGIVSVLETIRSRYPDANINYLSTTPVVDDNHKLYKKMYIGGRINGELKSINYKVMQYSKENNINYIHVFDDLLDDTGYLNDQFTPDGIHLNDKGYALYSAVINKHL